MIAWSRPPFLNRHDDQHLCTTLTKKEERAIGLDRCTRKTQPEALLPRILMALRFSRSKLVEGLSITILEEDQRRRKKKAVGVRRLTVVMVEGREREVS
ncbi:hypothetical protein V6N13_125066 [Hibiscus sabdariffa]|uniref:Uncharacterized protein n=1 Tax=Hibiscus sabdariffa TaxID=183260 RepID=A0ABR2U5C8_9ROSI